MILSIVVAIALDGAIGRGNDLLWHLPADLKRFKELTTGHTILMGRKTFDSLPRGPLPNRRNIVVSRSLTTREGVEVYPTIEEALKACESDEEVFIIGGGEIYRQLLSPIPRSSSASLILLNGARQQARLSHGMRRMIMTQRFTSCSAEGEATVKKYHRIST